MTTASPTYVNAAVAGMLCAVESVGVRAPTARRGTTTTTSPTVDDTTDTVPLYGDAPAPLMVTLGAVEPTFRLLPASVTRVVVLRRPLAGLALVMTGAPT